MLAKDAEGDALLLLLLLLLLLPPLLLLLLLLLPPSTEEVAMGMRLKIKTGIGANMIGA